MRKEKVKCPACGRWIPMYASSCVCELKKGGKMRETPVKHLPVVKAFAEYFIRKAKKDLKVKRKDYKTVSVEYTSRGFVYVWFHARDRIVANTSYRADGTRS